MFPHLCFPLPFHRNHFTGQLFVPSGPDALTNLCPKGGWGLMAVCVCRIHQEWSMWFCVWDSFVGHSLEELSRVPGRHTRLELQESICLKLLRHSVPFTWSIWLLCPSVWLWSFHSVDNKTETRSWNLAEDKLPVTTWKQLTALHELPSWLLGEILLHFYVFYVWICVGGKSKITFNHWACSSLDKILLYSHYFYMT